MISAFLISFSGSESGAVGVTSTEICPREDDLLRNNFNLRGHHSAISIVAWNQGQMKLASCDLSGIIYVWVPNEERWSVELVNDRGVKVGYPLRIMKICQLVKKSLKYCGTLFLDV